MRERHLCTTFKLKTNLFCRQRAGLEVLIKVTSKQIGGRRAKKVLQKLIQWFLIVFFLIMSLLSKLQPRLMLTKRIRPQLTQMMHFQRSFFSQSLLGFFL